MIAIISKFSFKILSIRLLNCRFEALVVFDISSIGSISLPLSILLHYSHGMHEEKKYNCFMRIGIAGTLWLNTPPTNYGGTESVIANLVNGLTKKGHDVSFFGPATAKLNAKIIPTIPLPLRDMHIPWENTSYTLHHFTQIFNRAKDFDLIHVHLNKAQDYVALPFSVYTNTPTLFTTHFRLPDKKYHLDRYTVLSAYPHLPYSSISKSQQVSWIHFIGNIYNAVNLSKYPFSATTQEYFVWLGKIMPIKGTKEAILAAKKAKVTLYILGVIDKGIPQHLQYFEEEIAPLIDNQQILLYQSVGLPQKAQLLGKAKALLNPIQWEEPFGLVMIEAQATGTPVIAYKRGASPEVVQEGKTGFLVENVEEMVAAMGKIDTLRRQDCRAFVEEHFTTEKMVEGYLEAYKTVIQNWPEYYKRQTSIHG